MEPCCGIYLAGRYFNMVQELFAGSFSEGLGCSGKKNADYADAGVSRLRSSSHNLSRDVLPTRACRSFQSRPAVAAALELPKSISKSKSNAQSRLRQQVLPKAKQRRVARALASISVISVFFSKGDRSLLMKHNLDTEHEFQKSIFMQTANM